MTTVGYVNEGAECTRARSTLISREISGSRSWSGAGPPDPVADDGAGAIVAARAGGLSASRRLWHAPGRGRRHPGPGDAAAVRQLAAWARKHVPDARPRCPVCPRRGRPHRPGDGTLQTTALEIEESRIVSIFITRNPDKLIVATELAASRHSIH